MSPVLEIRPGSVDTCYARNRARALPPIWQSFPPGWTGKSREWHSVAQEIFLLEGDLSQPGIELEAPAYLYIPAGKIHGPFSSKNGAVYLYKFDAPFDINYCEEEG